MSVYHVDARLKEARKQSAQAHPKAKRSNSTSLQALVFHFYYKIRGFFFIVDRKLLSYKVN